MIYQEHECGSKTVIHIGTRERKGVMIEVKKKALGMINGRIKVKAFKNSIIKSLQIDNR